MTAHGHTPTPARSHLIKSWPATLKPWGIPKAAAMIHALLLSSPSALESEDIKEHLMLSSGSVSTQLSLLEDIGLVERHRLIGSRRSRFSAVRDPGLMFSALAASRKKQAFDSLENLGSTLASIAVHEDAEWLRTVGQLRTLSHILGQWLELCIEMDPEWTVRNIQDMIEQSIKIRKSL